MPASKVIIVKKVKLISEADHWHTYLMDMKKERYDFSTGRFQCNAHTSESVFPG